MNKQGGMIRPYNGELAVVYRLVDVFIVGVMLWPGMALRNVSISAEYVIAALLAIGVFYVSAQGHGV